MTEAEWMPSPVGERDVVERRQRVKRHDWLALTVAPILIIALTIAIPVAASSFLPAWGTVALTLALIALDFIVAIRVDGRREALVQATHEPDRTIQEEFGVDQGWFVDLMVHRGAAPIGTDRGVMWLEEGRLMFSGHRTSFALTPEQTGPMREAWAIPGLRHGLVIPIRHPSKDVSISLRPLDGGARLGPIKPEIQRWQQSKPIALGGQLPPTVPGPGLSSRSRVLGRALFGTIYWLGLITFLSTFSLEVALAVGCVGIVVGAGMLGLWSVLSVWYVWFDLGRLDDERN